MEGRGNYTVMDLPFLLRPKSTDSGHCNLVTGFPFPIEFGKKEISETFQVLLNQIEGDENNRQMLELT